MKSNVLALAIAAACMGLSSVTLAQEPQRHMGRDSGPGLTYRVGPSHENRYYPRAGQREPWREERMADRHAERRADRRESRQEERQEERRQDRRDDRWDARQERRDDFRQDRQFDRWNNRGGHFYNARGPQFRRGGYIPGEFRHRQYHVVDYNAYRLSAPPRGHHWVQVGADYVLIAIATGLIASIVLNQ